MALTYSTTTPAALQTGFLGTQSSTVVSNTFSPPANSLIVLVVETFQSFNVSWQTPTFTDSLGTHLTWHLAKTQADNAQSAGAAWVAWANCPSAQTNMTVSATIGVIDSGQYVQGAVLEPIVFTGADTINPLVNISSGVSTSTSASVTMSPIYAGSNLLITAVRTASSVSGNTAGSGCYLKFSNTFGAAYSLAWFGTSGGPTPTAGVDQTVALNTTDSSNVWQYIAFELAPPHAAAGPGTGWTIGSVEW